jgi:hypothetical protein
MAQTQESNISCGVYQLFDLYSTPESILHEVISGNIYDGGEFSFPAFYVFSDNFEADKEGTKLAAYIERHKLGRVIASRKRVNGNTHNLIQVWIWSPNERSLRKWARKHGWNTEAYHDGWDLAPQTRWTHNEY